MSRVIRIGSRDSELALWQANAVRQQLHNSGVSAEIITVKSEGDLQTDTPLYELGITGIFTRTLDIAMLNKEVDIAVHSMKDVPTALPKGIVKAAVLKRANPHDVLAHKGLDFLNTEGVLATGSLRRKAQWLHRYPLHEIVDLRGNVPTRLKKLQEKYWNGAIFAAAGLERLGLLVPKNHTQLSWMIPAPAQGAIMVVALASDEFALQALESLNHKETEICTGIEREFLRELEGGCSAPIGALAQILGTKIRFKGLLASLDGQQLLRVDDEIEIENYSGIGVAYAQQILVEGGNEILSTIKTKMGQ
ncbi:MAG: hydroxymethylbilane synthase [Flavobacteriaceae bacterium]